jgi:hypothetical protein
VKVATARGTRPEREEIVIGVVISVRVWAHVLICVLTLLFNRIFELNYLRGKCLMEPLEEISKSKLIKYKVKF